MSHFVAHLLGSVVHEVEEGVDVLCDLVLGGTVGPVDGPRRLRRTAAAVLLDDGADLRLVAQRQMGLHVLFERMQSVSREEKRDNKTKINQCCGSIFANEIRMQP